MASIADEMRRAQQRQYREAAQLQPVVVQYSCGHESYRYDRYPGVEQKFEACSRCAAAQKAQS